MLFLTPPSSIRVKVVSTAFLASATKSGDSSLAGEAVDSSTGEASAAVEVVEAGGVAEAPPPPLPFDRAGL